MGPRSNDAGGVCARAGIFGMRKALDEFGRDDLMRLENADDFFLGEFGTNFGSTGSRPTIRLERCLSLGRKAGRIISQEPRLTIGQFGKSALGELASPAIG